METTNDLITAIIRGAHNNIPAGGWDNFSLNVQALNKMIAMKAFYEYGGNIQTFDPEEDGHDNTLKIKLLREKMYALSPGKGAWYTAYFTVQNNGTFQTSFDYENKPAFKYMPDKDKFIDDLKAFPKEKEFIPEWLNDMVHG